MSEFSVQVTVETPARGPASQVPVAFTPAACSCSWSWGLQPATALIDWVSVTQQPDIVPMAQMTLQMGGHTFYGLAKEKTPVFASDGITLMQQFVDSREFLQWDNVFGLFNRRENKIVNGRLLRRYWHILPVNYWAYRKTYTNTPYTGDQILDFLFGAPTVESPWARYYHPNLLNPVYNVDCLSGKKLGTAVLEISERLGTVFTLLGGRYDLVWTVKGIGPLPDFPANSDNRRGPGLALSGHPTRITALGERSCYQVMDLDLEPDWRPAYQVFYDVDLFAHDLYLNEATEGAIAGIPAGTAYAGIDGDEDGLIGKQLARARALTITVGDYAVLRDARSGDGEVFRDYRKFAGRSRMGMPVALYIRVLLFKAFRPPFGFTLHNANGDACDVFSMELQDRALVEVSHDPVSGEMSWLRDVVLATNGYAIAQGYQVGSDAFKTLRPEHFKLNEWVSGQQIWQRMEFQIDDSGEGTQFIIFDEPVIRSADLMMQVSFDGQLQDYPVLNMNATITAPPVRASLIFAAERFAYTLGYGSKDDVENVDGLNGEYVAYANGNAPVELAYADGQTATQKADAILEPLLGRQFYYQTGGYTVRGSNATQLSPVIDRVSVEMRGESGMEETVDFTNERARNADGFGNLILEPDRDFDRRQGLQPLMPGQRELKVEANALRLLAAGLKQNSRFAKFMRDAFYDLLGYDERPAPVFLANTTGTALPAGTPLWREADGTRAFEPSPAVDVDQPVFVGVTVLHNTNSSGPVAVTASGVDGVALVRVKGPVAVDDPVGFDTSGGVADSFLVGSPQPTVGTVLDKIEGDKVKLIRVRMGSGASTGVVDRGEYKEENAPYALQNQVFVAGDGTSPTELGIIDGQRIFSIPGVYLCVKAVPKPDPEVDPALQPIIAPCYPHPTDPADQYWRLIAFGPSVIGGNCSNSGGVIDAYANDMPVPSQE